ncbi:MAG TPA: YlxR family protein [Propioniciclava tarda]|nr:YlxR family protein [Propioniciclava tarda]HQA29892.1 YlxR family protein [Propioniciclava tarda]HQD60726.1 YlxR family protein [Propioniciclava tarda]
MPTRTCVGCRVAAEQDELTRIVVSDGVFSVDAARRLPGRGAYVHPGCVAQAIRSRGVQRTLKVAAVPSDQLDELLRGLAAGSAV